MGLFTWCALFHFKSFSLPPPIPLLLICGLHCRRRSITDFSRCGSRRSDCQGGRSQVPVANLRRRRRCWQPVSGQEPPPWQLGRLLPAERHPPPIPTSCRTRLALMSLVLGSTYQKVFAKMLQPSANPWFLNQIKSIKILDPKDFLFVLKSSKHNFIACLVSNSAVEIAGLTRQLAVLCGT